MAAAVSLADQKAADEAAYQKRRHAEMQRWRNQTRHWEINFPTRDSPTKDESSDSDKSDDSSCSVNPSHRSIHGAIQSAAYLAPNSAETWRPEILAAVTASSLVISRSPSPAKGTQAPPPPPVYFR
ncbi:hypothetical protein FQN57_002714 [Myotisia sp. PD_48]|nr:hypothetical protein FQN57_002714 [Myotisia sp. PD_48]